MPWFGNDWGAPICEGEQVPRPVDTDCFFCEELIGPEDDGEMFLSGQYVHKECAVRNIVGNPHHFNGECLYVGHCNELSKMTYREESLEVWRLLMMGEKPK